jgi:hypothetical protein
MHSIFSNDILKKVESKKLENVHFRHTAGRTFRIKQAEALQREYPNILAFYNSPTWIQRISTLAGKPLYSLNLDIFPNAVRWVVYNNFSEVMAHVTFLTDN